MSHIACPACGTGRIGFCDCSAEPNADHGISPAQLREKVGTLTLEVRDTSDRLDEALDALKLRVGAMEHRLNLTYAPLLEKVEALEQMAARHEAELKQIFEVHCEMLDRINQLVEFHGILPIDRGDKP